MSWLAAWWVIRSLYNTQVSGSMDGLAKLTLLTTVYPRCRIVRCCANCIEALHTNSSTTSTHSTSSILLLVLFVLTSTTTAALGSTSRTRLGQCSTLERVCLEERARGKERQHARVKVVGDCAVAGISTIPKFRGRWTAWSI